MQVIHDLASLDAAARSLGRAHGLGGAFVPTMGALHEGHAALVRRAAQLAAPTKAPVIVSIFVNPTQFNERADFDRYPRTLEADAELCRAAGATIIFAPSVETMYPTPAAAPIPPLPRVATDPKLEDAFRPGHFAGVCQVVMRLFKLVEPDHAIFGEKDWQQLQVITAMTAEAKLATRIIPHPTLRDPDGLAMSSRNRFLTPSERTIAPTIHRVMQHARSIASPLDAEAHMLRELQHAGFRPEYAVVRDAITLGSPTPDRPARILVAARLGSVRLIDNIPR